MVDELNKSGSDLGRFMAKEMSMENRSHSETVAKGEQIRAREEQKAD